MMITTIGDRLKQIMTYKGHKPSQLAEALGYSNAEKLHRIFRDGDAKPGYDTIMDIAGYYPDMNIEWFMRGVGDMLVPKAGRKGAEKVNFQEDNALITSIRKSKLTWEQKFEMSLELLREYAGQIERLQRDIEIKNRLLLNNTGNKKS